VATSVLVERQDSQGGGVKTYLRRSTVTGWGGDWRGGTANPRRNLGQLDYITARLYHSRIWRAQTAEEQGGSGFQHDEQRVVGSCRPGAHTPR
jgi:hypothetical protein